MLQFCNGCIQANISCKVLVRASEKRRMWEEVWLFCAYLLKMFVCLWKNLAWDLLSFKHRIDWELYGRGDINFHFSQLLKAAESFLKSLIIMNIRISPKTQKVNNTLSYCWLNVPIINLKTSDIWKNMIRNILIAHKNKLPWIRNSAQDMLWMQIKLHLFIPGVCHSCGICSWTWPGAASDWSFLCILWSMAWLEKVLGLDS